MDRSARRSAAPRPLAGPLRCLLGWSLGLACGLVLGAGILQARGFAAGDLSLPSPALALGLPVLALLRLQGRLARGRGEDLPAGRLGWLFGLSQAGVLLAGSVLF